MYKELVLRVTSTKIFKKLVTQSAAGKSLVNRFVAGETIPEAILAVRNLNNGGIKATIDCLGEDVTTIEQSRKAALNYHELLENIARSGVDSNVSLKLTQMGLSISPEACRVNLIDVASHAKDLDNFVRIDMESSKFTDTTLDIFHEVYPVYPNTGIVIQTYLYRSEQDLKTLLEEGARVRLCKGAYSEPETIAYPNKKDVDKNYKRLMEMLILKGNYPGIATHDVSLIGHAKEFSRERGVTPDMFEFQMLYGVKSDLQKKLSSEGWGMRVYVPFGNDWYGYLTRRLAERPANLGFLLKNLI